MKLTTFPRARRARGGRLTVGLRPGRAVRFTLPDGREIVVRHDGRSGDLVRLAVAAPPDVRVGRDGEGPDPAAAAALLPMPPAAPVPGRPRAA